MFYIFSYIIFMIFEVNCKESKYLLRGLDTVSKCIKDWYTFDTFLHFWYTLIHFDTLWYSVQPPLTPSLLNRNFPFNIFSSNIIEFFAKFAHKACEENKTKKNQNSGRGDEISLFFEHMLALWIFFELGIIVLKI